MYLNKLSSGTILALLAMSGILLLVPLTVPANAANTSAPSVGFSNCSSCYGNPLFPGGYWFQVAVVNPTSNQFAITSFTITAPNGWTITSCDWGDDYIENCVASGNTATYYFYSGSEVTPLPPGAQALPEVYTVAPAAGSGTGAGATYPFTGSFSMTVQDQASVSNYYPGNSFSVLVIDPTTGITLTVTPGGSNSVTSYTAGTAPYSLSAKVKCTTSAVCPGGVEQGVPIGFTQTGYNLASTGYSFTPSSGVSGSAGTVASTFQPTNIATDNVNPSSATTPWAFTGPSFAEDTLDNSPSASAISTGPGSPTTVGYTLSAAAFPAIDWLPFGTGSAAGTTMNTNTAGTFSGAVLCVATQQTCTGASPANTAIGISAADKWGNPDSFGAGGVTFVGAQTIMVQTASGGLFDVAGLPSSVSCGVTAGFVCPVAGISVAEPFNYYQAAPYGTAGVLTSTITGTYAGSTFSVSGSSGTIETSTFATTAAFDKTDHVTALPASMITAGKSVTFDVVLNIAQANVPITVAVCAHTTCGGTSKGYSGTIAAPSGITNKSGIYSTTLTVDTKATHAAILNATVLTPINGAPKTHFVVDSAAITTVAGSAAKFTVVVGPNPSLSPSYITSDVPGATAYVNVVTSDAYANPVSTVGPNQVQITLVANPNTITVTSAYIPTNCFETNGTSGNGCSSGFSSFGPIAWTLPSTIGATGTISATGVLNGAVTTSATQTITIVSKLPTISVFSPKPLNSVIYSNSVNVQFRGWANASLGYNDCTGGSCPAEVTMSSLGWKVGSGTWQNTGLAGTNAQWSVISTLPSGLSTVQFNATDSKANVVLSSTYSVLVDTGAPTVTDVTAAGSTLNAGQLFQATVVDTEGDLNTTYGAHGVQVTYNGTVLASSAVQLSGSNNLGSSVTYSLTALLPTGHWSVVVSAQDLAGNSGSSAAELVSVTVAFADSITFNTASTTYGSVGAYKGITVSVTNLWSTSQTIVVYATLKSGTSIYVAQGTVTLAPGQTASVFAIDIGTIPAGTYTVTYSAVTTSNQAVSAPTTPITVTAT